MISLSLAYDMRAPEFGAPPEELYRAALDQCAWADSLGFESVTFMEHHATIDGYLPSPIVMAAAAAARTERMLIRLSVVLLPLYHPLRAAEDLAVLDLIARGRLRITVPASDVDLDRLTDGLAVCVKPEAMLFDLDGVLADVEGSYRRCVLETMACFGLPMGRRQLQREVATGEASNDWELVGRLLEKAGLEIDQEEIVEVFQRIYLGSSADPGLCRNERLLVGKESLRRWARKLPLGLVTGRPRAEARAFLDRFGIADLFAVLVTMEDGPAKPSPSPVSLALDRLGVDRAWMIGDTVDDVAAARAAGVMPWGVVAPGDDPELARAGLLEAGAVEVLAATAELEGVLR